MTIFAFVGYMGSGKTTIAKAALAGRNNIVHFGFSDPMIEMMRVLGVPESIIENKDRWNEPLAILSYRTLRHATQTIGTEWGRNQMHPNFWLNQGMQRACNLATDEKHSFIDNVRFPNEFNAIDNADGILIALRRKSAIPSGEVHESEQYINQLQARCHVELYNDGTIAECVEKLGLFLDQHK
jgi:hypothetical protein